LERLSHKPRSYTQDVNLESIPFAAFSVSETVNLKVCGGIEKKPDFLEQISFFIDVALEPCKYFT